MGKRRKFTNEFKLEAVKLAERGEVPVAQVARELDGRKWDDYPTAANRIAV